MSSNRNNITRKVELLLAQYLRDTMEAPPLILTGHDRGQLEDALDEDENIPTPHLLVFADGCQPHPDMPTGVGVRVVALRLIFRADSTVSADAARERLDPWRDEAETLMDDIPALRAYVNPPDPSPDNREIIDITLDDVLPESEPNDTDGTDWLEEMQFGIVVQLCDSASDRPRNTVPPAISGDPYPGETLTVDAGTWDAPEDVTGSWIKNGVDTEDASATYDDTEEGDEIYWQEIGTAASGERLAWSNVIAIVAAPEP